MSVKFGPAGNGDSFARLGYKHSESVPEYLLRFGLDHFEYQCGRGVNISEEKALKLGALFKEANLSISLHAPYYISMSSVEKEKRLNSVNYILQSARAVNALGGNRIVVHTGSCSKISREEALSLAKDTMMTALDALKNENLEHIHICPETMGKINQLGTIDEVIALCELHESLIPCIDFGHLNARTLGEVNSKTAFSEILEKMSNKLGKERAQNFHSHFSKIEYTTGGEKRHLTFEDMQFGPDYQPLMELLFDNDYSPTIVCESAGTQAEDAKAMKDYYLSLFKG